MLPNTEDIPKSSVLGFASANRIPEIAKIYIWRILSAQTSFARAKFVHCCVLQPYSSVGTCHAVLAV